MADFRAKPVGRFAYESRQQISPGAATSRSYLAARRL